MKFSVKQNLQLQLVHILNATGLFQSFFCAASPASSIVFTGLTYVPLSTVYREKQRACKPVCHLCVI